MKKAQLLGIIIVVLIAAIAAIFYYLSRPSFASHIRISTNAWVGYTPLMYAQEKGWLENTPFRFIWLVDLSENARLYERGFTQGFTTTQYEIRSEAMRGASPVFLIDRSAGADAILSNRTVEELRTRKGTVNVYLERGSLNDDFFHAFVKEKQLEEVAFNEIDMSQKAIVAMAFEAAPTLIVSYHPYLSQLVAKGYKPVATTRDIRSFQVIDALFVKDEVIRGKEKDFTRLKEIFGRSVQRLKENPEEYYETIRGYLEGQSYEEFIASTQEIEWFDGGVSEEVIEHLKHQSIRTDRLLP